MSINLQEIITKLKTARGELQRQQRFAEFATGLDEIISHTSEPLMLMVMGSFSTGKSSFINALVGEEIAAVEAKPTTAVVTKLCYGEQDKLFLHFRDGKVQPATPKEFNRMTAVNDEAQLNEIHDKLDYVERQMPLEILKQVSIIDSPGLNDVQEKHSEATERFVSKADTVLWMFSTVQLATREEMAAMDRLTPRLKPIAVVNKMDLLDEEEDDPQEFLAKAKQTLKDRVQAVVGISAKYELEGKKEHNALKREIGNFAELEKAVADLVLPYREKFKLNTLLDELGVYFAAFNREFAKAKEENEAQKGRSYERYMENAQAFMQIEDILNGVTSGILDYCEREAGQNNEQALYLLGVLYEGGIGVLQDTDKALQFYHKAAMKNHQCAMVSMYIYYSKQGSDDTANYWLKKLAEQGLSAAQNDYADSLRDAKQYEEAVHWYEKAAKQGNACSQAHLVEHYIYGVGVATDYDIAKQWCEKAVEQDYLVAQYFMAEYFVKNQADKYGWYRKSAEQGYAVAQNIVGRYLEEGWGGVKKNKAEAVEWFRKAAEQGYAVAQYNLGNCLYSGRGCAEDKAEAFSWYKKAAEQNITDAQNAVGRYLEEGWGGVTKNQAEAVEWYRKAANNKDVTAQYNLANCLFLGQGCDIDEEEAVEWFRKAAEQGHAGAQCALAKCLENGRGCDTDKEEAVKWCRKAAEHGDADAQYALACYLKAGKDYKYNNEESFKWYKKAAEQGMLKAQKYIVEKYIDGKINFSDFSLPKQWCRNVAMGGSKEAQYYMGEEFSQSDDEKYKWYIKSAKNGYAKAQNMIGLYYQKGLGSVDKDENEAIKWYRRAAKNGYTDAQYNLGVCLSKVSEHREAFEWYWKAAENGNRHAQTALGDCFITGHGCAASEREALKWYRKAAEQGDVTAKYAIKRLYEEEKRYEEKKLEEQKLKEKKREEEYNQLKKAAEQGDVTAQKEYGNCLYHGEGGEVNKEEAVEWYRKAAEQGDMDAQYALAQCLEHGEGCNIDAEEALLWYRKAAKQGYEAAKVAIGRRVWSNNKNSDLLGGIIAVANTGNEYAQYIVAEKLYYGEECDADKIEALKWYKLAAKRGNKDAQKMIIAHCFAALLLIFIILGIVFTLLRL